MVLSKLAVTSMFDFIQVQIAVICDRWKGIVRYENFPYSSCFSAEVFIFISYLLFVEYTRLSPTCAIAVIGRKG